MQCKCSALSARRHRQSQGRRLKPSEPLLRPEEAAAELGGSGRGIPGVPSPSPRCPPPAHTAGHRPAGRRSPAPAPHRNSHNKERKGGGTSVSGAEMGSAAAKPAPRSRDAQAAHAANRRQRTHGGARDLCRQRLI